VSTWEDMVPLNRGLCCIGEILGTLGEHLYWT
jgi:hypothetical protein